MKISPLLMSDSYKQAHHLFYPEGTEYVYSNTTARKSRVSEQNYIVVFGIQYFIKEYLINQWNESFFSKDIEEVLSEYHRVIDNHLSPNIISDDNIRYLHSLRKLPLRIKSLPEGTKCPIGVPFFTIVNTDPKCYWLTNFIETISQTILWMPITSATTSHRFRHLLDKYAEETSTSKDFVQWQGHDFSMRGMTSLESAASSGAGHLLSFSGTDSIPSISFLEEYYNADITKELIGCSVKATEHSIQCAYYEEEQEDESEYVSNMLKHQDGGIISIVSDGYDYWKLLTETLPKFKEEILSNNGKVVIRPDTGTPYHIICGYKVQNIDLTYEELKNKLNSSWGMKHIDDTTEAFYTSDKIYCDLDGTELTLNEVIGSVELLYRIFGGTVNNKGYIELDSHIGLIYGDSITYDSCLKITNRLKEKSFSSTNVVYGIGSYTFQYTTRDTYGLACKATWVQINGKSKNIFKDPKTGDGMKKSAKGLLCVKKNGNSLALKDECSVEEEKSGELVTVFEDGKLIIDSSLSEIRDRLNA